MQNSDITILVVDDEGFLLESIVGNLEIEGFNVVSAGSGEEALSLLEDRKVHFVLSDIRMPKLDGVRLLEKIREYNPDLPVVVLMSGFSEHTKEEVLAKGATDLISKPFSMEEVIQLIHANVKI